MYISLLQKMVNEFSWPAKIMASPFNLIKNWPEFSYLDQNVILSMQQDMESLYLLALSQINIPNIRAILFDHITCNNTWKHCMSQSTQHYHIYTMWHDQWKLKGLSDLFHSHRCGALWSEVRDKGPQIAKKWLKRTNQGEHAKNLGRRMYLLHPLLDSTHISTHAYVTRAIFSDKTTFEMAAELVIQFSDHVRYKDMSYQRMWLITGLCYG